MPQYYFVLLLVDFYFICYVCVSVAKAQVMLFCKSFSNILLCRSLSDVLY